MYIYISLSLSIYIYKYVYIYTYIYRERDRYIHIIYKHMPPHRRDSRGAEVVPGEVAAALDLPKVI